MIITVLATPNGIVLIDEIENGLHFSIHELLWELLIRAATSVHVQIIATTHSEACLDGAFHAMKKLKSQPDFDFGEDEFSYIRMAKSGSSMQARFFDQETYSYAMQTGIELR
jgi:ATPase-like protein